MNEFIGNIFPSLLQMQEHEQPFQSKYTMKFNVQPEYFESYFNCQTPNMFINRNTHWLYMNTGVQEIGHESHYVRMMIALDLIFMHSMPFYDTFLSFKSFIPIRSRTNTFTATCFQMTTVAFEPSSNYYILE